MSRIAARVRMTFVFHEERELSIILLVLFITEGRHFTFKSTY